MREEDKIPRPRSLEEFYFDVYERSTASWVAELKSLQRERKVRDREIQKLEGK